MLDVYCADTYTKKLKENDTLINGHFSITSIHVDYLIFGLSKSCDMYLYVQLCYGAHWSCTSW